MDTRNPSPPPDADSNLESFDQIGNSVYSKRWLYSLILKVLTKINEDDFGPDEDLVELDSSLEDELCCLWDIASDENLLVSLREFHLVPIFTDCIHKSKCPRLTEISFGILSNLSLDEIQCGILSEDPIFMSRTLGLLSTDDTRILIELFRLLRSVLASRQHRQAWLDVVHFAPDFIERVNFILCSSTNASLLMSAITVIETILRIDDILCELWCSESLLLSLQEAQKQIRCIHGDEVEVIYRILYIFSTNSTGVRTLMSRYEDIFPGFGVLFRKICEDEPHLIPFSKYNIALRIILPVIDVILTNLPPKAALESILFVKDLIPCLLVMTVGCTSQNFVSDEVPLHGLWEDLSVLFVDLIKRVYEFMESGMDNQPPAEVLSDDGLLCWLCRIEEGSEISRGAFVRCCLCRRTNLDVEGSEGNTAVEVLRGHLVFICQRLCLPKLLECSTTNHN